MNKNKEIVKAKKAFKKIKKIEIELSEGNFENLDYFLQWSGHQGLSYALEWVSYYGKVDLIKKVLAARSNIVNDNASYDTALQMACRNGHIDAVKYLVESGIFNNLPDLNILLEVVENRHIEIATYLLSNENIFGTNICDIHCDYDCAFRLTVQMNNTEMTKLLVKYGADINVFDGYPLIHAAKMGFLDIVKLLLTLDIDIHTIPFAIDAATINNHNDIVMLLTIHKNSLNGCVN